VTGRGKAAIEDTFDVSFEWKSCWKPETRRAKKLCAHFRDARVSYVRQQEALGLGHAVLQARDLVGANRLP